MLLRFFAKVHLQAIQYGLWSSLRPSSETRQWFSPRYGWGGGKLIMILEIVVGAEWFRTES